MMILHALNVVVYSYKENIMEETCGYCHHHIWADHLVHHICVKKESDEEQGFDETCSQWHESTRLTGGPK